MEGYGKNAYFVDVRGLTIAPVVPSDRKDLRSLNTKYMSAIGCAATMA